MFAVAVEIGAGYLVGRYVSWRWWWVLPIAIIAGVLSGLLAGIVANAALMLLGYQTSLGIAVLSTIRNAFMLGPILATATAFITRYKRRASRGVVLLRAEADKSHATPLDGAVAFAASKGYALRLFLHQFIVTFGLCLILLILIHATPYVYVHLAR